MLRVYKQKEMNNTVQKSELCGTCGRYNSRHMVVNGIVEYEGKILLIQRGIEPGYGKWALPGGYLDWDESIEEGVIREVREETGLNVQVQRFFGFFDSTKRNFQNVAFVYILKVIGSTELKLQTEEIIDAGWYTLDSLPAEVAFDHNVMLAEYKKSS